MNIPNFREFTETRATASVHEHSLCLIVSKGLLVRETATKVPAVTLGFWIIKILATTLGETGGDTVTMTWLGETTDHPVPNGYLIGTAIWAAFILTRPLGATVGDFLDKPITKGGRGPVDTLERRRRREAPSPPSSRDWTTNGIDPKPPRRSGRCHSGDNSCARSVEWLPPVRPAGTRSGGHGERRRASNDTLLVHATQARSRNS